MKRNTTPLLHIIMDVTADEVDHIEFVFKQTIDEDAPALVTKTFPSDDVSNDGTDYFVQLSLEDTKQFKANDFFYLDTHIHMNSGMIPETNMVKLKMEPTLIGEE